MQVALHLGNLRGHGSRQVGHGILRGLTEAGAQVAHAWVPRAWEHDTNNPRVTRVSAGALAKFASDNVIIRYGLQRCGADCLFSVGDTSLPRPGLPHLLMVQQAFLAYPPEALDFDLPLRFRAKLLLLGAYFRAGLSGVSHITVQTQDMKQRLIERWGLEPERVSVIPSAIDAQVTHFARAHGEISPTPYLCYLATPGPHKNFEVLAPVMASLQAEFPSLRCALTVQADQVPKLARSAARLGVLHKFAFHGSLARSEALRLLALARIAVIPSKLESFGLPYYESMALGVPIVAADRAFAREACGEAARYASADDARAFADHARVLLASQEQRTTMVNSSKQRFRQVQVDWSEIGRRYMTTLERLTERAPSAREQAEGDKAGGDSASTS